LIRNQIISVSAICLYRSKLLTVMSLFHVGRTEE